MNVYYRKTVVGWWNIYPAGLDDQFINLNSEEFFELLPQVSRRTFAGSMKPTNAIGPLPICRILYISARTMYLQLRCSILGGRVYFRKSLLY